MTDEQLRRDCGRFSCPLKHLVASSDVQARTVIPRTSRPGQRSLSYCGRAEIARGRVFLKNGLQLLLQLLQSFPDKVRYSLRTSETTCNAFGVCVNHYRRTSSQLLLVAQMRFFGTED
jgi:hypothetical protein